MAIKDYILLALIVAVIILGYSYHKEKSENKEHSELNESLGAELETWKDKDSLNRAKIQVLETSNVKTFLAINSMDSTVRKLQKSVKEFEKKLGDRGSVTNFNSYTVYDTIRGTQGVVTIDSTDYMPLPYSDSVENKWIGFKYDVNKYNTNFKLKVFNEYTVAILEEKKWFLGKSTPYAEVINKNPYSNTDELRTYQVSMPPRKMFSVGPHAGVDILNGFTVGVSVQYSIVRF